MQHMHMQVVYHFHSQHYGRAVCIPFHRKQYCMYVLGLTIFTASSMDLQGVYLSNASSYE
jgi:hypothetical protein